jgi:hypothetical protein
MPLARRGTLAEGVLVEASVVVRLLKLRLLTLDASIVVVPPLSTRPARPLEALRGSSNGAGRLSDAIDDLDRTANLLARARAGTAVSTDR